MVYRWARQLAHDMRLTCSVASHRRSSLLSSPFGFFAGGLSVGDSRFRFPVSWALVLVDVGGMETEMNAGGFESVDPSEGGDALPSAKSSGEGELE